MMPQDFIEKWRSVELKERTAAQSHFKDLCRLLGVPDPISADPKGEPFTLEKGASKTTGGEGWPFGDTVTITLKREVKAHVANRLQAALWREAIHMVADGVASLEDIDTAVHAGPVLRWAVMGPHLLLNLGGGEGGLKAYCEQFRDSYHDWWGGLGRPKLDDATIVKLAAGLKEEISSRSYQDLRRERDVKLVAVLKAIKSVDAGTPSVRQTPLPRSMHS